jgi:biopolymer transport protein TolR
MSVSMHRRHHRGGHKKVAKLDSVRNDINVTPLVDVCLVLLIIFMVILPMLERGKDIPGVPKTRNHFNGKDNNEPIVAIQKDGKIFVEKEPVRDLEAMKQKVQDEWNAVASRNTRNAAIDRSGENRVLIKADAEVRYNQVYPVIIALHDLGAVGVDLGTNELKDGQE